MVPRGDGGVCRVLYDVHQMLSFGPCTDAIHGAPGHNRSGVAETPLPVKSQGRNVDRLLSSRHKCCCRGFFNRMRCLNWEATTTVGCPAQNGYCARAGHCARWRSESHGRSRDLGSHQRGRFCGSSRVAVPLVTSGHTPQGDQPKNWRAPSP